MTVHLQWKTKEISRNGEIERVRERGLERKREREEYGIGEVGRPVNQFTTQLALLSLSLNKTNLGQIWG